MRPGTNRVFGALIVGLFAACSSSSTPTTGGTDVEGLNTPTQLSIVSASDDTAEGGGALTAGAGATDFPATADYNTDQADVWVYDPSVEPIGLVNEILCMVSQTRAGAMVNQGPYIAQIDTTRCAQGADGGDDNDQSSGATTEFEFWTVDAMRQSSTASQQVSVWVPDEEGGDNTIFVDVNVTEGVSNSNPFGVFTMDFASAPDFASIDEPEFIGSLNSLDAGAGEVGFTFFMDMDRDEPGGGSMSETTAVNVTMSADQESGVARVSRDFEADFGFGTISEENDFAVAFNETHLLRADGDDAPVCLSREEFDTKVWRYNLYHSDGDQIGNRVELNSGFGFKTEGGQYGWMGYYGMWVPDGTALTSGDTITEDVWGDDDPAQYTVFQAPGRLIRFSREAVALEDIAGQTFNWWSWDEVGGFGVEYQIAFDGSVWTKTAVRDDETGQWTPVDPPEALTFQNGEWLGLWSESLGGHVDYLEGDACGCVTIYTEEFVTPSDEIFDGTELSLFGFSEMLASNISEADAEIGDVYLDTVEVVADAHAFTFDRDSMTLLDGNDDVVGLAAGAEPAQGPYTWGMRSGPMVTDTSGLESVWDIFNETTYYVWETGHNDWNRYTAAIDSEGDPVVFDPPIQFSYTHELANDRNGDEAYDGQVFFLGYEGPGNLWGIPHEGVDTDGDEQEDRWYPVFSINDGVAMGPNGDEYVIRAIEMEQTLADATGECDELDLSDASSLTLPDASGFTTPDIGAKPDVDDPPAVVEGAVLAVD